MIFSENPSFVKLEVSCWYGYGLHDKSAIFYSAENAYAYMNLDHVVNGHFVLGRDVLREFADYWPLPVSMPPIKLCTQCKAAVYL